MPGSSRARLALAKETMAMSAFIGIDDLTTSGGVTDTIAPFSPHQAKIPDATDTGNIDQAPSMFHCQVSKEIRI
jgi:hypothetical protein